MNWISIQNLKVLDSHFVLLWDSFEVLIHDSILWNVWEYVLNEFICWYWTAYLHHYIQKYIYTRLNRYKMTTTFISYLFPTFNRQNAELKWFGFQYYCFKIIYFSFYYSIHELCWKLSTSITCLHLFYYIVCVVIW